MKKTKKRTQTKKTLIGTVVSNSMDKTAVVLVESRKMHPVYKKGLKFTKKYKAHDEINVKIGEMVRMVETRPISKLKRWEIVEVIKK